MTKCSLKKAEIISFITASILGVIFHFVYEWSGENPVVSLFFPMNESTWEHLKLIFYPVLLLSIIEYFLLGIDYPNFFFAKFLSVLLGMIITVVLFYTYTGIYGKNSDGMNILIYFVSMAAAYLSSYRTIRSKKMYGVPQKVGFWGFVVLLFLFMLFSVFPPDIGLFRSPV